MGTLVLVLILLFVYIMGVFKGTRRNIKDTGDEDPLMSN